MTYIKFFIGCLHIIWFERVNPNGRAKSRRIAREFERLSRDCGLGTRKELKYR